MIKPRYVIGVDPDVDKSGFAVVDTQQKKVVDACGLSLFELLDKIRAWAISTPDYIVIVEGGWLNKISNYHDAYGKAGMRVAKNVGSNHQRGKDIAEGLKHYGIKHEIIHPLKKNWKGKDGKITREELAYFTGFNERTNQDIRDAVLLGWYYAGLPIRVKTR